MRLTLILVSVFVVVCGALFAALNRVVIPIDFYLVQVRVNAGIALLGTLAIGWLLGGFVAWMGHGRLRRDLRAARRARAQANAVRHDDA